MSWHPYERNRRLWTVYWGEREPAGSEATQSDEAVVEFELTEPYSLHRDKWSELQMQMLVRLTPPDYTLNVSQLWTRLWPSDGALIFSKMHDVYKVPIILSSQPDSQEQPGKRKDFYWVMSQVKPEQGLVNDLAYYQGVDLENVTWITEQPIEPWPTQLFEYNRAAFAWNSKLLKGTDFDQIVRRECWGVVTTHLGSLDFMTTRARLTPERIQAIAVEEGAKHELELEFTRFEDRPRKPNLIKSLSILPRNILQDSWRGLKARNKHPEE